MFCTNKLWLDIKSIPANFIIQGNGKCNITVQLNKNNDNKFKKVKSDSKKIDLKKTKVAKFNIKRANRSKKFRIVIDNCENSNLIKIKNIQFRNGKYKFYDMDKYTVTGAKAEVKNNELIIYPKNEAIYITYNDKIKVKASMKFNFEIFVIILVLSFLLIYKASDYVADFSSIKHKSRIDIVFLLIFFSFLFVPMSHINQDKISKQENRRLATWQPFIKKNGEINFNFGKDYEKWFNDRFNLRQEFLNLNDFKLFLSNVVITKDVLQGKDGWLFLGWHSSIISYMNKVLFSDKELSNILSYLNRVDMYCKKHNKKFYFVIAPDKSRIYKEFYPDHIKQISQISKAQQLMDYLEKHSEIKTIYLKDKLISKKDKGLLYWKQDTHWNMLGAYYGYQEIMDVIIKDFPGIPVYKVKEYTTEKHTGDLYNMAPSILKKEDNIQYKIPKVSANEICNLNVKDRQDVICSNSKSNINLLMYRDSFTRALIPFIANTFGDSKYIWNFNINLNAIKDADVVILLMVERHLIALANKK